MAHNTPLISIIIVNHNGMRFFDKLFHSTASQTYPHLEVLIVDSGSTDTSRTLLRQYKNIHLYKTSNRGYAAACNVGVHKAKGQYVLIMNADVWFNASFVEDLWNEMNNRQIQVIGPREHDYDGHNAHAWDVCTIDPFGYPVFLYGKSARGRSSFYLSGLCFLVSKKLYLQTGGLDDHFFMYFEETDWFWRLNLLKIPFAYSTQVAINHYTANTTTITPRYNLFLWRNQNCLQMLLKNYSWQTLCMVLPVYVAISLFEMLFFLFTGRLAIAYTYLQGYWFNIVHLKSIGERHMQVQHMRKVSDVQILRSSMYCGVGKLRHFLLFIRQKNGK